MDDKSKHDRSIYPTSVRIAKFLFFVMGCIWLVLSLSYFIKFANSLKYAIIMSTLMAINAAIFFWLGWGVARTKVFFFLAMGYLLVNILLSITDEFGLLDILTMLMDMALLVLIIVKHKTFRMLS